MSLSSDPVPPAELIDYAHGTLSIERRIAVAATLAENPDAAARMMRDLQLRDELIVALRDPAPSAGRRRRAVPLLLGATALALLALVGLQVWAPLPAYVEFARHSHANSQLRLVMETQIETPDADLTEILAATGIRLPRLPSGWQVLDVQVYPSPLGPSVEMAMMTEDNGLLSLFAVRTAAGGTLSPAAALTDNVPLAFFQVGDTGYVLVGAAAPEPLDDEARLLFDTLI